MQQVQKVNDYCTLRENCPKSRRREKNTINNSSVLCTIDRLLTDACNKDFIALVQLRGTFSTENNAINTHFLHRRKKLFLGKFVYYE
jgi:hypothetical protein